MTAEPSTEEIHLPKDLWERLLTRFDHLLTTGDLLYAPSTTTSCNADGFDAVFQVAPHLKKKPVLSAEATERKVNNAARNPFSSPDPDFVLAGIGSSHVLMINKFCVYRPSLLLVTKTYAPQSDVLNDLDISASWQLLQHLSRDNAAVPLMVFYNCGAESGSSQGHKHLQIVPYPTQQDVGFDLFPTRASSSRDVADDIPGVPHKHFVLQLPRNADTCKLTQAYKNLLRSYRDFLGQQDTAHLPHNLILTDSWICLIPRRTSGYECSAPANALGMLGVIWTSGMEENGNWTQASGSIQNHLQYLGFPK